VTVLSLVDVVTQRTFKASSFTRWEVFAPPSPPPSVSLTSPPSLHLLLFPTSLSFSRTSFIRAGAAARANLGPNETGRSLSARRGAWPTVRCYVKSLVSGASLCTFCYGELNTSSWLMRQRLPHEEIGSQPLIVLRRLMFVFLEANH